MGESLVPIIVALLGGSSMVVAAVLTRRSGSEDRVASRQDAEVRYLSERLDKERDRTDALEAEVAECHEGRDRDREEWRRRFAVQDERIEHMSRALRRFLPAEGAT